MNFQYETSDLIVFSHRSWNTSSRISNLFTRFANFRRVLYIEEPSTTKDNHSHYIKQETPEGVTVVKIYLSERTPSEIENLSLGFLLNSLLEEERVQKYTTWYTSPMALHYSRLLKPLAVIYDCTYQCADIATEQELLNLADIVFVENTLLYETKKHLHKNMHLLPNCIDHQHFSLARKKAEKRPVDLTKIGVPCIGYFGDIDDQIDFDLVTALATEKPKWHFVFLGKNLSADVSKVSDRKNIHFLGEKNHHDLLAYLSHVDCGFIPLKVNEITNHFCPNNAASILAAGKPVVATPIQSLSECQGAKDLIYLADNLVEFTGQIELALRNSQEANWLNRVDAFLERVSWDKTWDKIVKVEWSLRGHRAVAKMAKSDFGFFDLPQGQSL